MILDRIYFAAASAKTEVKVPRRLKRILKRQWTPHEERKSVEKKGPNGGWLETWSPYDDFKATVLSPITKSMKVGIPTQYLAVPVWGLTGGAVEDYWKNIVGGYVIFYTGHGYPYIGRISSKEINRKLAKTLWPHHELSDEVGGNMPDDPWSHILYFDVVWEADIPKDNLEFLTDPKGPSDLVVRGFRGIPPNRQRRLPTGVTGVIEEWTDRVAMAAIRPPSSDRPPYQTYLRLLDEENSEDELVSEALICQDIDIKDLRKGTKKKLVDIISDAYD